MAGLPKPQPGLVISYSYLWLAEAEAHQVEGRKDRPCAVIVVVEKPEGKGPTVAVVPITHVPPADPAIAMEIPLAVKAHLGLDTDRSWVILNEFNVFTWPGYDLRGIGDPSGPCDYGLLPPALFAQMTARIKALRAAGAFADIPRDDPKPKSA